MSSIFEPSPAAAGWPRYQHVIFDCDSTLSQIEGIDELAGCPNLRSEVSQLTDAAMNGSLPLHEVYGKRLEIISPSREDIARLTSRYRQHLVEGAAEVIRGLQLVGNEVYIVSGGLLEPVHELGVSLGIRPENIRAVDLVYDDLAGAWWSTQADTSKRANQSTGQYLDYRRSSLCESEGKTAVIRQLLRGRSGASLLIGDGVSDLMAGNAVDLFVGFGGVTSRPLLLEKAPVFLPGASLLPLLALALGSNFFFNLDPGLRASVSQAIAEHPPLFNRQILRSQFERCFC